MQPLVPRVLLPHAGLLLLPLLLLPLLLPRVLLSSSAGAILLLPTVRLAALLLPQSLLSGKFFLSMFYPPTLQKNRMYANNCPECRVYFYHFCWTLLSKVIPGANGFSSLGRSFAMITYMKAHCRGELCFAVEAAKYEQQDGTKEMQGCLR